MKRAVTYWYTKDQPIFENTDDMPDTKIDVTRILGKLHKFVLILPLILQYSNKWVMLL